MGGGKGALSPAIDLVNIKDGLWHQVHVVSDGTTISYTFDGKQMASMSLATAETYLGGSQYAYFGFTGATGGLSELQQVKLDALTATTDKGALLQIGGGGTGVEPTFTVNGNATNTSPHVYLVTPDALMQQGSVISNTRVDLTKTFDITFDVNLGNKANGADGMGFVFENDPLGNKALGSVGGGKGMLGINNGLGIEFDTFQHPDDPSDIPDDHTNFVNTMGGGNGALSPAIDLGNIKDGVWHQVHVVSNGTTISYTFDSKQMASMSLATAENYLGASQYAYFGFTGATGGLSEPQQVRLVGLNATAQDGTQLQITGGGTGTNRIISGAGGNTVMTGGPGNDVFVYSPGFGNETITDFSHTAGDHDIIDLRAFHFASAYDALNHVTVNGTDSIFNFGNGDTLTVQHSAFGNVTNLLANDLLI
jgi:hypothetical protein